MTYFFIELQLSLFTQILHSQEGNINMIDYNRIAINQNALFGDEIAGVEMINTG